MKLRLNRAYLGLTSDGAILVNVGYFDGPRNVEAVLKKAIAEGGELFIGVVVTAKEKTALLRHLGDASMEAGALLIGARRSKKRRVSGR